MHARDNAFFEEYKRLDKLCSDIYSCKNGVSEYIADMEGKTRQGQARVPSWSSDYKMLKHVRWVRNQIAHDTGTYEISQPSDLAFVQDFYSRIISGEDPLTLLGKATNAKRGGVYEKRQQAAINRSKPQNRSQPPAQSRKKSQGCLPVLIVAAIIALILAFFFFYR